MPRLIFEKEDLDGIHVGNKVWFDEELCGYTAQARNERYIIFTKPFNLRKTVLYTILDTENMIRGPENLVFGFGAETREQCENMIKRLHNGDSEISHRHSIEVNIRKMAIDVPDEPTREVQKC